jgi:hypothetical protein
MATAKQRRQIAGWIKKWKARLLLSEWAIVVEFAPQPHPSDVGTGVTVATADPTHRYTTLNLTIYPGFFEFDAEQQEQTIVHELIHAPASHTKALITRRVMRRRVTQDEADDVNERLVEYMTKVVLRAYS